MARNKERRGRGITVRTPRTREDFLTLIANGHTIKSACEALEVSRAAVHKWFREEPEMESDYKMALEEQNDMIRAEVWRRGVRGVRRTKYIAGRLVFEREYSDRMLELLAKGRLPEHREVPASITVNTQTNVTNYSEAQLQAELEKRGLPMRMIEE